MKKYRQMIFATTLLLLTTLACAVPGLSTPTAAPAPTTDPAQLEIIIAETVSAAITLTAQVPAPTQPPISTPKPTATDIPITPTPVSQSSLSAQDDGTTLFTDDIAKFQMNVPPGWLPVRIDQPEYYDAFSLPTAADPAVQTALLNIKSQDPNIFRLFIYDLQDGHIQNEFVTNVNIVWTLQGKISLDSVDQLKEIAQSLPASIPNISVKSTSISNNAAGIPLGIIQSEIPGKTSDGLDRVLVQKQVFINLNEGALTITFTTDQSIEDATLPFFDTMIDTVKSTLE